MGFDKFRNRSIRTGKGILGVFSICVVGVGLFILIASLYNKSEFNVSALVAIILGLIGFYVAMTRKVKE
ncbi:hypothetical protein [uncultured Psychrosphaera sp.]|jgi:hypothetical protein|uniref:hypothetical protein n=1 Tax=uncultured Psychrosphaera sp. TaxID=1403522 RepID=UPI00261A0E51|nr:hypothetical protein [uncultured Psychrosphaera sp.]